MGIRRKVFLVQSSFSFLFIDSPFDPLVASESDRVAVPEKLDDTVVHFDGETLFQLDPLFRKDLRVVRDKNVVLSIVAELFVADLEDFEFFVEVFRHFFQEMNLVVNAIDEVSFR